MVACTHATCTSAYRLVVILDGSLFYVTVSFSFLLVYDTSKKKVVFFPLKLKA
jgi:hypothetical protein